MITLELEGVEDLNKEIRSRVSKMKGPRATYVVGYTAEYAIYVHENLTAYHSVGQAKFLEVVIRIERKKIMAIINSSLDKKESIDTAIKKAALYIQRQSMQKVPVDTGALRASAYTKKVR